MVKIRWTLVVLIVLAFVAINTAPLVFRWNLLRKLDFEVTGIFDERGEPLQEKTVRFLAEEVTGRVFDLLDVPHREPGAGRDWIVAVDVTNHSEEELVLLEAEYALADNDRLLGEGRWAEAKTLSPGRTTRLFFLFRTAVSHRVLRDKLESPERRDDGEIYLEGKAKLQRDRRVYEIPFHIQPL